MRVHTHTQTRTHTHTYTHMHTHTHTHNTHIHIHTLSHIPTHIDAYRRKDRIDRKTGQTEMLVTKAIG